MALDIPQLQEQVDAIFDDIKSAVARYQPPRPRMLASDPRPDDPAPIHDAPPTPADDALFRRDVIAPSLERIETLVRQAREQCG